MTLISLSTSPRRRAVLVGAGALLATAALSACSGPDDQTSTSTTATGAPTCPLSVTDSWVKAADSGMSAAFATLTNTTSTDVHVTGATSPATSSLELHEVVTKDGGMVMQPVDGGFTVPAGGTLTLEPGGYHLMLMDLTGPVRAGDEVPFTLSCGSSGTTTFDAKVKEYDGGDEEYHGDSGSGGMSMNGTATPAP